MLEVSPNWPADDRSRRSVQSDRFHRRLHALKAPAECIEMTEQKTKPARWVRNHRNGWDVEVTAQRGGGYRYVAKAPGAAGGWSGGVTAEAARAQDLADERVPPHGCDCRPWAST